MITLFRKKNIHLVGIEFIRSFTANRFTNENKTELDKLKKDKLSEFETKKAEVEKFRANLWKNYEKKIYYGAFTFILYKEEEGKENGEEMTDGQEQIHKFRKL